MINKKRARAHYDVKIHFSHEKRPRGITGYFFLIPPALFNPKTKTENARNKAFSVFLSFFIEIQRCFKAITVRYVVLRLYFTVFSAYDIHLDPVGRNARVYFAGGNKFAVLPHVGYAVSALFFEAYKARLCCLAEVDFDIFLF